MNTFAGLKPSLIWKYFYEITCIPRPSKQEQLISNYLVKFAHNHNLSWKKDKAGNVVIRKPSRPGYQFKETLVLQSHMDMVCEKDPDSTVDFTREPIPAYIDGDWVRAKGTTLGADNGIGVAAQLALLADNTLNHGRIECLFTIDEESGMTGAKNISPRMISGSILINLDSEDEGELFIGCAGGMDTVARFLVDILPCEKNTRAFSLNISGLQGGHSGDDINKGRGNALKIVAELLYPLHKDHNIQLAQFSGGNLRNAIPRDAQVLVITPASAFDSLQNNLKSRINTMLKALAKDEPQLRIDVTAESLPSGQLSSEQSGQLLETIHLCPNGVIEMSTSMPGLVQTSTNLASIRMQGNTVVMATSQRSSNDSSKQLLAQQVQAVFEKAGAQVTHSDPYPGWEPDPNSEIVRIASNAYENLFGNPPMVKAIHAGLECGLLLQKFPGLDIVSFGPTIRGAHSPAERLEIASVEKFWKFLIRVVEAIPDRK